MQDDNALGPSYASADFVIPVSKKRRYRKNFWNQEKEKMLRLNTEIPHPMMPQPCSEITGRRVRQRCVICLRSTTHYCQTCLVPLCVSTARRRLATTNRVDSCEKQFHEVADLKDIEIPKIPSKKHKTESSSIPSTTTEETVMISHV